MLDGRLEAWDRDREGRLGLGHRKLPAWLSDSYYCWFVKKYS